MYLKFLVTSNTILQFVFKYFVRDIPGSKTEKRQDYENKYRLFGINESMTNASSPLVVIMAPPLLQR